MPVDYNDERLLRVENDKNNAINETKDMYNSMINNTDKYYEKQIQATKDYEKTQTQLQNAQLEQNLKEIQQNKDLAQKNYIKEQKGAYTDYQKATNQYGVNAEKLATQGLNATGYSESTRTNAYNTYQNRYATAKESYNNAVMNYDNEMAKARLQNSSTLAQIAYQSLQQQLELSLNGFQYKNTLIQTRANAVNEQVDRYNNQYQQVLSQINTENSLAEQIRQYNESMAWDREKYEREYALALAQAQASGGSSGRSSGGSRSSSGSSVKSSGAKQEVVDYGNDYDSVLRNTRALKNNKILKATDKSIEKYLGRMINDKKITEAGANRIIQELGL